MAVKGKSKSGAAPGAPKPKIEPRKTPLTKRPAFRRAMWVVLALLVVFVAMVVWGKTSRAGALREYDRKLTAALKPFQKHNEAGAPTNLSETLQRFAAGQEAPARIEELTATWEKDFAAARDAVRKLDPPDELTLAQSVYAESLDAYIGVARLAKETAGQKQLAARITDKRTKRLADAHVQGLQTSTDEWRTRAEKIRGEALAAVNQLKADWGLGEAA